MTMTHCNGPCDQGRLPCPCPSACGLEEPPEHDLVRVVLFDVVITVMILACVAMIVLGVMR